MGKFGKKNIVSSDLSNYMIGIMAPSGFGKTTLMYKVCDKLFGDDGYIVFDTGAEAGVKAINGVVSEHVPTFEKLEEIVVDIVKNKKTDYPNLKVVIFDTLDAYFEIANDYVIKDWNSTHASEPNFKKAKSINSVEGGYGQGMERVIEVAKRMMARLNSVGVGTWWTAHIKEKDQTDLFTGTTFTSLTANMTTKYFNSIKNSSHIVACGYYDRAIEKIEVGDENPVTKKKKKRSTIVDETRKIKFRDDLMVADAKSRFAHIIDEIPLDVDSFIKAITDAINAEQEVGKATASPIEEKAAPKAIKAEDLFVDDVSEEPISEEEPVKTHHFDDDLDITEPEDREKVVAFIRNEFKTLSKSAKSQIKDIKGASVLEELPDKALHDIVLIIEEDNRIED